MSQNRNVRNRKRHLPDRPVEDLDLGSRAESALKEAGMTNVGEILKKLEGGEVAMLEVPGIGRKTLIDMKKALRKFGYKLPKAAEEVSV